MSLDEKKILDLKAQHGDDLHLLENDGEEVVVKAPSREIYKRYRAMVGDEKRESEAHEQLLRDCCVYPDAAGLSALLDRRPGLGDTFGGKVALIAGVSARATSRKL